jgi:aminoglycoside phosphotransferase (APT) family kinase protein
VPRTSAVEVAPSAAELLRVLHAAPGRGLEPARPAALLAAAATSAALVAGIAPRLARRLGALLARLEASAPVDLPMVPCHGDFNVSQFLAHRGTLAVLDFDEACLAAPALDLAAYAANLVSGRPGDLDRARQALDVLVDGYGTRPRGLEWYLAATLVRRAPSPFRLHKRRWPERVTAIVDAAEAVAP